jgi:hypothetical protein
MSDDPAATPRGLTWPEYKARLQEIERRLAAGEYTPEQAVEAARESGLIAASILPHLPHEIRDVLAFMPERYPEFFGPWLLVAFAGDETPRVYRPYVNPRIGWP